MKKDKFTRASIGEILAHPEEYQGKRFFSLYLPPDVKSWTLSTVGVFGVEDDDDVSDEDGIPGEHFEKGWIETIDPDLIDSVVSYAKGQLGDPTPDQLLKSFVYYYEEDAFLDF